jgi:HEAT repeat protein
VHGGNQFVHVRSRFVQTRTCRVQVRDRVVRERRRVVYVRSEGVWVRCRVVQPSSELVSRLGLLSGRQPCGSPMDLETLIREYLPLLSGASIVAVAAVYYLALLIRKAGEKSGEVIGKGVVGFVRALWRRRAFTRFEKRYRTEVVHAYRKLRAEGMNTSGWGPVDLNEGFVQPSLVDEPTARKRAEREGEEQEAVPANEGRGVRVLTLGEALREEGLRLAVLGQPGAGKSTLLSYIALAFAAGEARDRLGLDEDRLPVPIRLSEWSMSGVAKTLNADTLQNHIDQQQGWSYPEGFFRERLRKGKCVVLLDGLDEVEELSARLQLARQIEKLAQAEDLRGNRFVVTSRRAGYEGQVPGGFHVLYVRDLLPEEVAEFVRRRLPLRTEEAEGLLTVIQANEQIRALAVNPLLLTIMGRVYQKNEMLPESRVALYEELVRELLEQRDQERGTVPVRLKERSVLARVAYAMQEAGESHATRRQMELRFQEAMKVEGEIRPDAAALFKRVQERSGLIRPQGEDNYGFWHPTFREYLAAFHLFERGDEGLQLIVNRHSDPRWREVLRFYAGMRDATALIKALLALPTNVFWTNVLAAADALAAAGSVEVEEEEALVKQLVQEWRHGPYIGRRALAEKAIVHVARVSTIARELLFVEAMGEPLNTYRGAASILGQLKERVALLLTEALDFDGPMFIDTVLGIIANMGHDIEMFFKPIQKYAYDGDINTRLRVMDVFFRMENLGLVELVALTKDKNSEIRIRAVQLIGEARERSLPMLTELYDLRNDEDERVRYELAEALWKLGLGALDMARLLLRNGDNNYITKVLSSINGMEGLESATGYDVEGLIDDVIPFLESGSSMTRLEAVEVLNLIGPKALKALDKIKPILRDSSERTQSYAFEAIVRIGGSRCFDNVWQLLWEDQETKWGRETRRLASWAMMSMIRHGNVETSRFIDLVESKDVEVKLIGLNALGKVDDSLIRPYINSYLKDKDSRLRRWSIEALVKTEGVGSIHDLEGVIMDKVVGNIVIEALKGDNTTYDKSLNKMILSDNQEVRRIAVGVLASGGAIRSEVLISLRQMLKDENVANRIALAGALRWGASDALDDLKVLLSDDAPAVRLAAIRAIQAMGPDAAPAISDLLMLLHDVHSDIRSAVAEALRTFNPSPAGATDGLLALLRDEDAGVRLAAARALGALEPLTVWTIGDLLTLLRDEDAGVRAVAAETLGKLSVTEPGVATAALSLLDSTDDRAGLLPEILLPKPNGSDLRPVALDEGAVATLTRLLNEDRTIPDLRYGRSPGRDGPRIALRNLAWTVLYRHSQQESGASKEVGRAR